MKILTLLAITCMLCGCLYEEEAELSDKEKTTCRGEFTIENEAGLVTKRYAERYQNGLGCVTDIMDLTNFEKSSLKRYNQNTQCTPQVNLPSMWLRASNNYYTYRNNRVYLELNASTGEARRLVIAEMPDGQVSYRRHVFCYYMRTDIEVEPVSSFDYGAMILFDIEDGASSSVLHPMEIFNYQENSDDLLLTKIDDNTGVDWKWCPTGTPLGFCDYLRNGNEFFYPPAPDAATQAQLKAAAILIRSEMNFIKISESEFNQKWGSVVDNELEVGTRAFIQAGALWKYLVTTFYRSSLA